MFEIDAKERPPVSRRKVVFGGLGVAATLVTASKLVLRLPLEPKPVSAKPAVDFPPIGITPPAPDLARHTLPVFDPSLPPLGARTTTQTDAESPSQLLPTDSHFKTFKTVGITSVLVGTSVVWQKSNVSIVELVGEKSFLRKGPELHAPAGFNDAAISAKDPTSVVAVATDIENKYPNAVYESVTSGYGLWVEPRTSPTATDLSIQLTPDAERIYTTSLSADASLGGWPMKRFRIGEKVLPTPLKVALPYAESVRQVGAFFSNESGGDYTHFLMSRGFGTLNLNGDITALTYHNEFPYGAKIEDIKTREGYDAIWMLNNNVTSVVGSNSVGDLDSVLTIGTIIVHSAGKYTDAYQPNLRELRSVQEGDYGFKTAVTLGGADYDAKSNLMAMGVNVVKFKDTRKSSCDSYPTVQVFSLDNPHEPIRTIVAKGAFPARGFIAGIDLFRTPKNELRARVLVHSDQDDSGFPVSGLYEMMLSGSMAGDCYRIRERESRLLIPFTTQPR